MQITTPQIISGKRVLLRYDIDVVLREGQVAEDYKLKAGISTLNLCLQNASQVTLIGHLGRPDGKVVPELSVEPIRIWFRNNGYRKDLETGKLKILENLRFDLREDTGDLEFAKQLVSKGDIYINEAFSAHHPAVSTTILPRLLPHAAGLHFAQEVQKLTEIRENPKRPFIVIMGGVKVEDKLPAIKVLSQIADAILVGGKLVAEIHEQRLQLSSNVMVGKLNKEGTDIAEETTQSWRKVIMGAKMIVWNGPLGKFEDHKNDQTSKVAQIVAESEAESIVGGGDTISALSQAGLLKKFEQKGFVSTGGGAMLKFLAEGTLPTIEALK